VILKFKVNLSLILVIPASAGMTGGRREDREGAGRIRKAWATIGV